MKKLLMGSLIVVLTNFALADAGYCNNGNDQGGYFSRGDGRPWPFGQEILVPWRALEGVWKVIDDTCENYFIFRVRTDHSGAKFLSITQYDPMTCTVVARGKGYEPPDDKFVEALMSDDSAQSYTLTIHAFNDSQVGPTPNGNPGPQMTCGGNDNLDQMDVVMTLSPVGHWQDQKTVYELESISPNTIPVCQ